MSGKTEIDLKAFEKNYNDAKGYHYRAEQFAKEGQRHSLIFNVASIALENYLIALCELHGEMPPHHSYNSLMDAVENITDFPIELNRGIRSLDDIFGICSIENYHHGTPTRADSVRAISMCSDILEILQKLQRRLSCRT